MLEYHHSYSNVHQSLSTSTHISMCTYAWVSLFMHSLPDFNHTCLFISTNAWVPPHKYSWAPMLEYHQSDIFVHQCLNTTIYTLCTIAWVLPYIYSCVPCYSTTTHELMCTNAWLSPLIHKCAPMLMYPYSYINVHLACSAWVQAVIYLCASNARVPQFMHQYNVHHSLSINTHIFICINAWVPPPINLCAPLLEYHHLCNLWTWMLEYHQTCINVHQCLSTSTHIFILIICTMLEYNTTHIFMCTNALVPVSRQFNDSVTVPWVLHVTISRDKHIQVF